MLVGFLPLKLCSTMVLLWRQNDGNGLVLLLSNTFPIDIGATFCLSAEKTMEEPHKRTVSTCCARL